MKKFAFAAVIVLAIASVVFALDADVDKEPSCGYCGMNRGTFAHSRMVIAYEDGTSSSTCSLHCAAVDLANKLDKTPKAISVGDYYSKQLIDAETATWVLGGSRPGVMTSNPKWAFARKEMAEKFIKENGGTMVTFEKAIQAAYADMYQDTQQIREKRKAKRARHQKGQS